MAAKEFTTVGKKHSNKTKYLIVIAILCLSFSVAFILRAYPIKYGFYLNEFDPFFDYRATQYIVNHGIESYFNWHDYMSWYPEGRDIAGTSQSGLHITAAILYEIFGMNMSLMDFTIWFPVVIGSASTILMFLLVRAITGNSIPGLISSIFFAVSPAIIQRGNLGWFKSEPLGIFYGLGGLYLFISALKEKRYKFLIPKAIFSGAIVSLAMASWGGAQYFVIPIAIFIIILAFYSNKLNMRNSALISVLFTVSVILVSMIFPRPGMSFITGPIGILLISSTVFLFISALVKRITSDKKANLKTAIVLGIFVIIGLSLITGGFYKTPSFRYLNAVNPFISSENKLVESVAEHFTPTIVDYFRQFSILLIFSGLGIWASFKNKSNTTIIFALIIGLTGIYLSATFARLLVFASLSITILSSIGIYEVIRSLSSIKRDSDERKIYESNKNSVKTSTKKSKYKNEIYVYVGFAVVLIIMLTIPMVYDANTNWITSADVPTSIANGGTNYRIKTNDWIDTLNWISKNTPSNSTIASWWDYGYWITTLGNRTSLADNATINQTKIATIAKMFISPEKEGFRIANKLKADYILIYVVGQKLPALDPSLKSPIYILGSGGDESKKHWFIRIGGFNESEYLESNGDTPKPKYWDTLLGKMMPFDTIGYFDPNSNSLNPTYQPNSIPFYIKDIKYPKNSTGPLTLEYASKSFENNNPGLFFGVLLYKVNPDYKFSNSSSSNNNNTASIGSNKSNTAISNNNNNSSKGINSKISSTNNISITNISAESHNKNNISSTNSSTLTANNMSLNKTALIETTQGPIKIEFYPNVAPNHVKNFIDLANKGFYDGIVFHRIVPGFVIQAGDPNSKNDSNRQNWGTGGPGYTIKEEFNNISHERGILSMARTSDPNSAGSQFFIVLNDSKFLDNQYTVFGKVIQGMDIVDKIANTPTNSMDQPVNSDAARITKVLIQ